MLLKLLSLASPLALSALFYGIVVDARPCLSRSGHRQHDPAGPARRRGRTGARRQALLAEVSGRLSGSRTARRRRRAQTAVGRSRGSTIERDLRHAVDGIAHRRPAAAARRAIRRSSASPGPFATATAAVFYRGGRVFRTLSPTSARQLAAAARQPLLQRSVRREGGSSTPARPRKAGRTRRRACSSTPASRSCPIPTSGPSAC